MPNCVQWKGMQYHSPALSGEDMTCLLLCPVVSVSVVPLTCCPMARYGCVQDATHTRRNFISLRPRDRPLRRRGDDTRHLVLIDYRLPRPRSSERLWLAGGCKDCIVYTWRLHMSNNYGILYAVMVQRTTTELLRQHRLRYKTQRSQLSDTRVPGRVATTSSTAKRMTNL